MLISAIDFEINILGRKVETLSKTPLPASKTVRPKSSQFRWTKDKSELVEVVESLISIGAINGGEDKIKKQLYSNLGELFNIDLSNHNRILTHISKRKDYADKIDSRIHFLPQLIKSLANKLDELDCR